MAFPVHAVHVLQIEAVAVGAPGFVEDLRPFLGVIDLDLHVRKVDGIIQPDRPAGNVHHVEAAGTRDQGFAAARLNTHRTAVDNGFLFLFFQVIYLRAAARPIPDLLSVRIKVSKVGRADRQLHDAVCNTVKVNLYSVGRSRFLLLFRFLLGVGLFLFDVYRCIFLQERRRRIFREQREVDAIHIIIDMIPFQ